MGRRTASWLLFVAVLLHNGEEAITYAGTRSEATQLIRRISPAIQLPTPLAFQAALLVLSLAVSGLLLWCAFTRRDRAAWIALKATAAVLLANVVVPHVPAAIAFGGYAPGVITAVAVNLPLSLWILARGATPEHSASRLQA